MKEILKLTLSLTLICAIAGTCLALVSAKTAEPIKRNAAAQRTEKMMLLLPPQTTSTVEIARDSSGEVIIYKALDISENTVGYCAESSSNDGFGGVVKVMAGLTEEGKITALLVSEHSETPGIGSRVCDRTMAESLWRKLRGKTSERVADEALPPNRFLDDFCGRTMPADGFEFALDGGPRSVVAVSGATFSSTAVLHAVNRICAAWNQQKQPINFTVK